MLFRSPKPGSCAAKEIVVEERSHGNAALEVLFPEKDSSVFLDGTCIFFRGERYAIPVGEIRLLGQHNYLDIAFVYTACRLHGVPGEALTRGLKTYQPLPHRLAFLGECGGVKYYDDSISTICETAIQALNTIKDTDTVLIGGMDQIGRAHV